MRIELENEQDYRRAVETEAEIMSETGWRPPPMKTFATFVADDLGELVKKRLTEEGVAYR